MQGTLADLDLASLAAVTSLGRTSLRLEVTDRSGEPIGQLVLKAGRVVSATGGGVRGRGALHLIMSAAASSRFRLVREPLDYVLSSTLASAEELAQLGQPRFARSSSSQPPLDGRRGTRPPPEQTARVRMMQGKLEEFDLATVLQAIGMGRSCVELEVRSATGDMVGMVRVKAGKVVSAHARDVDGIAAIAELMSSRDSHEFAAFRIDADLGQVTALGSLAELLLAQAGGSPSAIPSIPSEAVTIMEGSLSEFDVATLLQTVACGRQHCALEVHDDERVVGTIVTKSSMIVTAAAGPLTAIRAVQHLVGMGAPHRFRLNRLSGGMGDRSPLGSIHQVLLQLEPIAAAPGLFSDAEATVTGPPPVRDHAPAAPQGDDHVGRSIANELSPVMEGSLEDFDLRTLLEALAATRQYSQLQIFDPGNALVGELRLKSGMIISARAGSRAGADALTALLAVSSRGRFRMLTGSYGIDAPPLGSIHELLTVLVAATARQRSERVRAGRVVRAAIPISFFLGGAIVFFIARGGRPAATAISEDGPVVQMKPVPASEVTANQPPRAPAPLPPVAPAAPSGDVPGAAPGNAPGDRPEPAPDHGGSAAPAPVRRDTGTPRSRRVQPGSVRTAQSALKQLGFDPGPIDNVYGKLTRDAVFQFQTMHSLPRTGVIDADTWSAIVGQLTN
jgi:hypothetical protein